MREEWWWPWDELPRSLRLEAVNLGYDRMSWQTEEFEHCGQRFLDMEELMFEMENPCGTMWRDDVDGVDCVQTMTYPSWYVERTGIRFRSYALDENNRMVLLSSHDVIGPQDHSLTDVAKNDAGTHKQWEQSRIGAEGTTVAGPSIRVAYTPELIR